MTERLNLLTVYPRDQQTCTALEASTPCKARLHWLCSFRARGVTRPLSVGTGQKTAALGYKDLPEGPSERGGGGRCSSEPDPLLSPSRHPHAPPSGQAGKNDTVWATGGCPQRLPAPMPAQRWEGEVPRGWNRRALPWPPGFRAPGFPETGLELALKQGAFWGKHKGFGQHLVEAGTRKMHVRAQVREAAWVCP